MAKPIIDWESIILKSVRGSRDQVESVLFDVITDGAKKYVKILTEEMASKGVPGSVIATAASLTPGEPELYSFLSHKTGWYKKGRAEIELTFTDANAVRPAFSPNGHDRNIVDLFNTGWSIDGKLPYGDWHGEQWVARRYRPKLGFMQSARRRAKSEIEGVRNVVAPTLED